MWADLALSNAPIKWFYLFDPPQEIAELLEEARRGK
jgi:hypothetical protein